MFRTILKLAVVLAFVSLAPVSFAQQNAAGSDPRMSAAPATPAVPAAAVTTPAAADNATSDAKASKPILRELSPWSMFLAADIIVKAVMVGLAFASLVTWTVFIAKMIELSLCGASCAAALAKISGCEIARGSAVFAGRQGQHAVRIAAAAMGEARLSAGISSDDGIKERAASSFAEIVRAEGRRVRIGMGLLASIGATSPFVGLFGTVWGIMNSFIGISKSQTTNLAVVAPGIAEALLATAFGLVAAIPAVIIYNHFARVTKGYLELVSRSSGAAARLLSRDLDRTHGSVHSRAAE